MAQKKRNMKNIDVIFPYNIYDPNGASTVVRFLFDYRELFKTKDISCQFFSPDVKDNKIITSNANKSILRSSRLKVIPTIKFLLKKMVGGKVYRSITTTSSAEFYRIYKGIMRPSQKIVREYIKCYDSQSTDAVFLHDIFTCYYYLKFRRNKKPILLVLHNNGETFKMLSYYHPSIKDSWVMRRLNSIEQYVLGRIDNLVFVSKNSRKVFIHNHPKFPEDKVHYVYNGIPAKEINKTNEPKRDRIELCCVASITDRKGQEIIVDALEQLTHEERKKIHVTFVGDGYLKHILQRKVNDLGIKEYISFVGVQTNVDSYLEKSDAFILPSRDEGLPIAIIEAQRAKLPIISTYIAGIPEMVEQYKSGVLFNPCVDELIPIFKNICNFNWAEMGLNSYEIYKNKFSVNQMIMNYASIINSLIKEEN